jgi:hypothetical protein
VVEKNSRIDVPESKKMTQEENPWCQRPWASGSRVQAERQAFAHADPPNGKTGYRTNPRQLSGKVFPHFWCEALQAFQQLPKGKERIASLPVDFSQGWDFHYQSACSQLQFEERMNHLGEDESYFSIWRRYDCEKILLTDKFATFFPTFIKKIWQLYTQIGIILEDVLMCAGRINEREFPRGNEGDLADLCEVSVERMFDERTQKGLPALKKRLLFIQQRAVQVIEVLKYWLVSLKNFESDIIADYQELWEHGDMLTGAVFDKTLIKNLMPKFRSGPALEDRIKEMKERLVMKAFIQQGQKGKLFPAPVKFESSLTIPGFVPTVSTELYDLCRMSIPTELKLLMKLKREGNTWELPSSDIKKNCLAAHLAVKGVKLKVEGCRARVMVEDKQTIEQSYAIGIQSILGVTDMKEELMQKFEGISMKEVLQKKNREAMTPSQKLDPQSVRDDKATSSVAWHMAKSVLMNAAKFLAGVPGAKTFEESMVKIGNDLKNELGRIAIQIADKAAQKLGELILSALEYIKLQEYRLLDVELRFVKTGDADFEPMFSVFYKRTLDASISFQVPGVMGIDGHIQTTQRYDLSPIFSEIYHAFMDDKSEQLYKQCLGCFLRAGFIFCFNKDSPGKSKCQAATSSCAPAMPIYDTIDCDRVDDNPEGGVS